MSFYNQIFGFDPLAKPLLGLLELNPLEIPRFRDCFLMAGHIVVYTRTGGPNRKTNATPWHFQGQYLENTATESWDTIVREHPHFVRSADDDYDETYAFWFFRYPDVYRTRLAELAQNAERDRPRVRWEAELARMKDPGYIPPDPIRKMFEQIAKTFSEKE